MYLNAHFKHFLYYKLTNNFVLNVLSNQLIESKDIVGIMYVIILLWASLFPFYLFCHFGGNITEKFEDIGDFVYQLEWYRLPLDIQQDLETMIAISQKKIYMRGYGDTRTTHSVFKKVYCYNMNEFWVFRIIIFITYKHS